jgi:hypothetical protein
VQVQDQVEDDDGNEKNFQQIRGFRVVHVFDISQTEGEELPDLDAVRPKLLEPTPVALEPKIPIESVPAEDFRAEAPYDRIFLARSPEFTPPTSDVLYDAIRERYITPL